MIPGDVLPFRSNDHGDDQREAINRIDRKHQDRPLSRLFTTFDGIQIDEIYFSSIYNISDFPRPSVSAGANSELIDLSSR